MMVTLDARLQIVTFISADDPHSVLTHSSRSFSQARIWYNGPNNVLIQND